MMHSNYPNILYLHSHDTGRYVQPYGHAIATPRIQRLAEEGVLLRKAFSAAPTCSPSRASLLTGQYAHCSGMLGLASRGLAGGGFTLYDYKQHLLYTLRNVGYSTALIGEEHLSKDHTIIGYDRVAKIPGYQADIVGLIDLRCMLSALTIGSYRSIDAGSNIVFAYLREDHEQKVLSCTELRRA